MSTCNTPSRPDPQNPAPPLPWYAVRVRSHFERVASAVLFSKGYQEFVPLLHTRRRWSDRLKEMDVPLFPGYVFCRFNAGDRLPILQTPGVVNVVSFGTQIVPIPEEEIRTVQAMVQSGLPVAPYPFLQTGQRIRVQYGPLTGVEGVVVELKKQFRLVASVTLLQRSVSVEIDREWVSLAS